jgi:hypothetical protein
MKLKNGVEQILAHGLGSAWPMSAVGQLAHANQARCTRSVRGGRWWWHGCRQWSDRQGVAGAVIRAPRRRGHHVRHGGGGGDALSFLGVEAVVGGLGVAALWPIPATARSTVAGCDALYLEGDNMVVAVG